MRLWAAVMVAAVCAAGGAPTAVHMEPEAACESLAELGVKMQPWAPVYGGSGFTCVGETPDDISSGVALEVGLVAESHSADTVSTIEVTVATLNPALHDQALQVFTKAVGLLFAKSALAAPGAKLDAAITKRKATKLKTTFGAVEFTYKKRTTQPRQAEVLTLHVDIGGSSS